MNKQSLLVIILFLLVNTLIAQTDNECGCEWDGNVTPELSVPPCDYTDNREDDSYRTFAAYACCLEKCKEKNTSQKDNYDLEWNRIYNLSKASESSKDYKSALTYTKQLKSFVVNSSKYKNESSPVFRKNMLSGINARIKDYTWAIEDNEKNITNKEISIKVNNNSNQTSNNTNSENIYDKKQREAREIENKRLKDGMEKSFQNLETELTTTFAEISNNWAKEKQFKSQLASNISIKSTDPRAIIKEAKNKSKEINITFSKRKNELLNQGTVATQKIIGAAETENQVIGGAILGTGLTILGQVNAEKQRKQAQQKLEAEKEAALIKLTQPIIDKFTPIAKQTLEVASFAVYEDEETYYLEQYAYAKCMIDKAYNIITSDYSCSTSKIQNPAEKVNTSGQDYYNAYKRKKNSSIQAMNIASETLLELAIEKEPNNAEWLYQKSLSKKITPEVKLSILNKTLKIKPNNQIYISEMLKTKELVDKRKRIDLEKEKRIDSKPFMILKDIPIFPGCKKKNKACFNIKINEHFNKKLNSKILKEKNIKRLFLNLIITEKGEFIYVNSRDYDRIVISEIERVINLLPKLEPTYLNKKAIAISYSLPLRIK